MTVIAGPAATDEHVDARGRRRSALISVGAAGFLFALKLCTGLATGSLAFLAEAAHSATDLVAALRKRGQDQQAPPQLPAFGSPTANH